MQHIEPTTMPEGHVYSYISRRNLITTPRHGHAHYYIAVDVTIPAQGRTITREIGRITDNPDDGSVHGRFTANGDPDGDPIDQNGEPRSGQEELGRFDRDVDTTSGAGAERARLAITERWRELGFPLDA